MWYLRLQPNETSSSFQRFCGSVACSVSVSGSYELSLAAPTCRHLRRRVAPTRAGTISLTARRGDFSDLEAWFRGAKANRRFLPVFRESTGIVTGDPDA